MIQKTELEIISGWDKLDRPAVSIACLTYNHELYIKDALDSFLSQKTTFPYEIIIFDDASTDSNRGIIKKYKDNYPNIIKCIFPEQNQYKIHKRISVDFVFKYAMGKYIAICEGDDFWIDPHKLQKQFDVLEKHPEIDLCLHPAYLLDDVSKKNIGVIGKYPVLPNTSIISFEDVVYKTYGQLPTGSTFFRTSKFPVLEEFFESSQASIFDVFVHMITSYPNGAYLLDEIMSVYRINVAGSWNSNKYKFGLDNHVFKRSDAFVHLQRFVTNEDKELLINAVFKNYILNLKATYINRATKLKILTVIKTEISTSQYWRFRLIAEFNLLYKVFIKLKNKLNFS
ncbi:MAG: glycosyltransferase [Pseudomonadota bacterium]|nr:glycosyltransferase [Pseudomonadota bacterium]